MAEKEKKVKKASEAKPAKEEKAKKEAAPKKAEAPKAEAKKAAPKAEAKKAESTKAEAKKDESTKTEEAVSKDVAQVDKKEAPVVKKKKVKRHVPIGRVFVHATFNNTIITFTDTNGNVLAWSSAGAKGFKGARKGTPFAAQIAAEDAARKAVERYGVRTVDVMVKGPGGGRESSLRAIQSSGIKVSFIKDGTPIPHNGCRPPKKRRV